MEGQRSAPSTGLRRNAVTLLEYLYWLQWDEEMEDPHGHKEVSFGPAGSDPAESFPPNI